MSQHRGNEEANLRGNDRHNAHPSPTTTGKLPELAQHPCAHLMLSAIAEPSRAILICDKPTLFRQRMLDRERHHALTRGIAYYSKEIESIVKTTYMARSARLKLLSCDAEQPLPRVVEAEELLRHGTFGENCVLFGLQFSR